MTAARGVVWGTRQVGMRQFHLLRNRDHCPIVNLDKLWSLVPEEVFEKAKAGAASGKAPVIDITDFGYFKVGTPPQTQSRPFRGAPR